MTVRDELAQTAVALTAAEAKIVRSLLADYPVSGLGPATRLARQAGVSDPTVMRLMVKLGYGSFAEFQARLLAEIEARLHSPLLMMETKRPRGDNESPVLDYYASVGASLERTRTHTPLQSYGRAVEMIFSAKGKVVTLGGRFSRHIASMLAGYLTQTRENVSDIGELAPADFDRLVDLGRRDLLIVFDYRRYQADVVSFASQAHDRGVEVLLFTDPWASPIARFADQTMAAAVDAQSPFDTMASAVAQMEAVVAHALATREPSLRARMEKTEAIRRLNAVTLDADGEAFAAGALPALRPAKRRNP